jgi:hypothetical protein
MVFGPWIAGYGFTEGATSFAHLAKGGRANTQSKKTMQPETIWKLKAKVWEQIRNVRQTTS